MEFFPANICREKSVYAKFVGQQTMHAFTLKSTTLRKSSLASSQEKAQAVLQQRPVASWFMCSSAFRHQAAHKTAYPARRGYVG